MADVTTADFSETPYWWDECPARTLPERPLPSRTDVAIIGSGYTGLNAALTLSRAGRTVHVFEAEHPGYGASTRNSGYIGCQLRTKLLPLAERIGRERAFAMAHEAVAAHKNLVTLLEREQIHCHFRYSGRYMPAHTPEAYESLAREADVMVRDFGIEASSVPRGEQRQEIGTDFYFGGLRVGLSGMLHPAMYHAGLLDRVLSSGVEVLVRTPVSNVRRESDGRFTVSTPRGAVSAGAVIMATNGYTGTNWFKQRIIPVRAGVSVSEPLSQETISSILPGGRTTIDTRRNPLSIRVTPDGRRLQFSAARGLFESDYRAKARDMHEALVAVFPQAAGIRVSHCWTGQMGFTFDELPHIGERDGVHYAMGYCGTGVPMSTWLGHKLALRVMGHTDGATAFDGRTFETRPFYTGRPWFLPAVVRWYNAKDKSEVARARASRK
jgi:glycine/D-amino acid oxidase-like deaminating enzyme